MIKKLVIVFVAIFSIQAYAQEGIASPYSFYGIGSSKFKGTAENRSMGGVSIYMDSVHVNLRNPASYAGNNLELYGNESRPVKFTVGGTYTNVDLKTSNGSANASASSFDYLALSVPIGKFGLGFGLRSFTSVGYKLESLNDDGDVANVFNGTGGVNKAFLALGCQITKNLSLGIDAHYNFGNIQNSILEFIYDSDGVITPNQSIENNRSDLSGLSFNLGLYFKTLLNEKLEFFSGLTVTPESDLISKNERSFSAVTTLGLNGQQLFTNTINVDLASLGLQETNIVLPYTFSFGAGIGESLKWFVGAEFKSQKTSNFSNPLYTNSSATYKDDTTFSLGGFYIPQYNSFSNYFKRATYRAGVRYNKKGLSLNNESIDEFGIAFGIGLPVGNGLSSANLGFEIGKRGTTNNNLIQENFVDVYLSLSLSDRWFQKRKYD